MLTRLLDLLAEKENGLSLAEIGRALNAQPSATLAMIQWLVRKGRLIEIGPDNRICTTCGYQSNCSLLAARGRRYALCSQSRL